MTKAQEKDLFNEWGLYEPTEQRLMIDEYLCVSEGNCSKERFLSFLKDKMGIKDREKGRFALIAGARHAATLPP